MKNRKTPLKHPNAKHIFNVYLEGKGMHTFKLPNSGVRSALAVLLRGVDREFLAELDEMQSLDEEAKKTAYEKLGVEKIALLSAILAPYSYATVAAFWAHPTKELETADRAKLFSSPHDYADDVCAEFEFEGYTDKEIEILYKECAKHTPKAIREEDVATTADFLQDQAALNSSQSTTESTTAVETQMDSGI